MRQSARATRISLLVRRRVRKRQPRQLNQTRRLRQVPAPRCPRNGLLSPSEPRAGRLATTAFLRATRRLENASTRKKAGASVAWWVNGLARAARPEQSAHSSYQARG